MATDWMDKPERSKAVLLRVSEVLRRDAKVARDVNDDRDYASALSYAAEACDRVASGKTWEQAFDYS